MTGVTVTSCLVVFLCCALFTAVVAQSGITQTTATLSEARGYLAATSSGDLVFFGGGWDGGPSDQVDIFNVTSGSWTAATLSVPRRYVAATSLGNLVFFAGGWNGTNFYNTVDIYSTSNGSWNRAALSQTRNRLAATSVRDIVLFGGGWNGFNTSAVVDIYNLSSNTWSSATLSQARSDLAAASVANRWVIFAGGQNGPSPSIFFNTVDICDLSNGMWSVTTLSQPRGSLTATSLGNLAFVGGGLSTGGQSSNVLDIFNSTTQAWSTATLSQARYYLAAASIEDIVAFGGGFNGSVYSAVVDVYNMTSDTWFTLSLSQPRYLLAATSLIDKIFFGGGYGDLNGYSNVVDILNVNFSFSGSPLPSIFSSQSPILQPSVSLFISPFIFQNVTLSNIGISTHSQSPSSMNDFSTPVVVVGIVVGVIALLIGIGVIIFVILFIKRKKQKNRHNVQSNEKYPKNEERGTFVLESAAMTIISSDDMNMTSVTSCRSGEETLRRLSPSQISINELEIRKEIGEGTYGRVCVGKWKKYRVALKFCHNGGKIDEFMREANLMISLPPHPNVVRMYGVSIDGPQLVIVMEYCAGGSLDRMLYDKQEHISVEQKISWIREIAKGMCHLHKYNIVHRDLAARNILLTQSHPSGQPKISDFGMSRVLQQDIEGKTLNPIGPIRWMAPESIRKQVYSKKSDVWMFGILVYEIVAQREPHVDIDPGQVTNLICDKGLTPKIPNDCPQKLQQLMEMCWHQNPNQRPTFETICAILEETK
jgi:hypothetical protein